MVLFPLIGGTFGLCFGTLYAPAQALLFHLSFEQTLLCIAAGYPWDVVHACGNVAFCTLVVPLSEALRRVLKKTKVL